MIGRALGSHRGQAGDAKADDGAKSQGAGEEKCSPILPPECRAGVLAVVVGKGALPTRDDGVAVIPMAALGA